VLKASLIVLSVLAVSAIIAAAALMVVMGMINNPPQARPDSVTVREDTPTPITLRSSDKDGDELTYYVVTGPSHGTLSGTGPRVTYVPEANYSGLDSFTFIANDGAADSNNATVSLIVEAVNDPPVANHQSVMTKVDRAASISLTGSDIDSDALKFAIVGEPERDGPQPDLHAQPKLQRPRQLYVQGERWNGGQLSRNRLDRSHAGK
jgi:hypothetical protein